MLTLKQLQEMEPNVIFKKEEFMGSDVSFRWVAVRGGIHDWAIYAGPVANSYEWVKRFGNKIYSKKLIRSLVPCDDESFKMYRY
jgi:hypothetical protein